MLSRLTLLHFMGSCVHFSTSALQSTSLPVSVVVQQLVEHRKVPNCQHRSD